MIGAPQCRHTDRMESHAGQRVKADTLLTTQYDTEVRTADGVGLSGSYRPHLLFRVRKHGIDGMDNRGKRTVRWGESDRCVNLCGIQYISVSTRTNTHKVMHTHTQSNTQAHTHTQTHTHMHTLKHSCTHENKLTHTLHTYILSGRAGAQQEGFSLLLIYNLGLTKKMTNKQRNGSYSADGSHFIDI